MLGILSKIILLHYILITIQDTISAKNINKFNKRNRILVTPANIRFESQKNIDSRPLIITEVQSIGKLIANPTSQTVIWEIISGKGDENNAYFELTDKDKIRYLGVQTKNLVMIFITI